jgi:hypothetical protein
MFDVNKNNAYFRKQNVVSSSSTSNDVHIYKYCLPLLFVQSSRVRFRFVLFSLTFAPSPCSSGFVDDAIADPGIPPSSS